MKAPEEIKLALDCFYNKVFCKVFCDDCPYHNHSGSCSEALVKDTLTYIERLECELNMAVNILKDHKICDACSHRDPHYGCDIDCYECHFEWKGAQEG